MPPSFPHFEFEIKSYNCFTRNVKTWDDRVCITDLGPKIYPTHFFNESYFRLFLPSHLLYYVILRHSPKSITTQTHQISLILWQFIYCINFLSRKLFQGSIKDQARILSISPSIFKLKICGYLVMDPFHLLSPKKSQLFLPNSNIYRIYGFDDSSFICVDYVLYYEYWSNYL